MKHWQPTLLGLILCFSSSVGWARDGFVLTVDTLDLAPGVVEARVKRAASLGARHFSVPVSLCQQDLRSHRVEFCNRVGGPQALVRLVELIGELRAAGYSTSVFPFLWGRDGSWRGAFEPENLEAWMESYQDAIFEIARAARAARVEEMILGSEMKTLYVGDSAKEQAHRTQFWENLHTQVRRILGKGPAVFIVANWDQWNQIPFWSASDYIALSSYFPLSESDPEGSWRSWKSKLISLAQKLNRPLYFAEVGYPSMKSAAREPWSYDPVSDLDLGLQADLFRVFGRVWGSTPALSRFVIWNLDEPSQPRADKSHAVLGKPAEQAIGSILRSRKRRR